MPLVALFIIAPLVELYVLIQVGQRIGALSTIGLCVLTAVVGAALLKHQGLQTLARARTNLDRGEVPALELFEGIALALGGVLLLTPGLITDAIGFACLLPFSRRWIVEGLMKRMRVRYGPVDSHATHRGEGQEFIEGEYERRDRDRDGG